MVVTTSRQLSRNGKIPRFSSSIRSVRPFPRLVGRDAGGQASLCHLAVCQGFTSPLDAYSGRVGR